MKIVTEEETFILPVELNNIYLLASENTNKIFDCLNIYFGSKKKTLCNIYNEDQVIGNKEFNFIYFPENGPIESNILFKQKSVMNTEFAKIINENQKDFQSIEHIRNDMLDLLTDKGFYKFNKIINCGLDKNYKIELNEFNLNLLLQMFSLTVEENGNKCVYMMIYNLLIHLNRNRPTLVYIDFEVDSSVASWLNSMDKSNLIIIINNDNCNVEVHSEWNIIIVNNSNFYDEFELNYSISRLISYLFKPLIIRNMQYQLDENIRLYNNFNDKETTFLIKFTDLKPINIL